MKLYDQLLAIYGNLTSAEGTHWTVVPVRAAVRWLGVFYGQLVADRAFVRAAAMAYTSLISLVPLLLLMSGILSATGLLDMNRDAIEAFVFETFLADIPGVKEVLLDGMLNIDLRALSVVGLVGLLIVVARLYLMVERAYNDIFGVEVKRRLGYRLLNFYFTLTAVPIVTALIFLGVVEVWGGPTTWWLQRSIQFVLMWGLLLAALKAFPCTDVRWGPAIAGAGVSAVLIELGHEAFRLYIQLFVSQDPLRVVYGSVGLIPVFLLWLYLLWIFALLGVEIANVAQNFHSLLDVELDQVERQSQRTQWPLVDSGLRTMALVSWRFREGEGATPLAVLAREIGLDQRLTGKVANVLVKAGLLIETESGAYLPGRPPEAVPIAEVVRVWRGTTRPEADNGGDRVARSVDQALGVGIEGTLADHLEDWMAGGPPTQEVPRPIRRLGPEP